jgi:hypothetical protein
MTSTPGTAILAIICHDALNAPSNEVPVLHAALHAAVHAWMEGHIEAESRAGTQRVPETVEDVPDPMPSPPFPDRHAPALAAIVDELSQRFAADSDAVAAVFVATGLGYQAGLRDGAVCPGCTTRSGTPDRENAARVRAGLATVMLSAGKATQVTLTE